MKFFLFHAIFAYFFFFCSLFIWRDSFFFYSSSNNIFALFLSLSVSVLLPFIQNLTFLDLKNMIEMKNIYKRKRRRLFDIPFLLIDFSHIFTFFFHSVLTNKINFQFRLIPTLDIEHILSDLSEIIQFCFYIAIWNSFFLSIKLWEWVWESVDKICNICLFIDINMKGMKNFI